MTASGLVDSIQRELLRVASTTPITQASSALAPLRGALQAAVTLHTFQTLREGLLRNERESMREYATQVLADANYQRILPENALEQLRELQKEFEQPEDSIAREMENDDELPKETDPPDELLVIEDSPQRNTQSPRNEQATRSILLEESLLQSHASLVR